MDRASPSRPTARRRRPPDRGWRRQSRGHGATPAEAPLRPTPPAPPDARPYAHLLQAPPSLPASPAWGGVRLPPRAGTAARLVLRFRAASARVSLRPYGCARSIATRTARPVRTGPNPPRMDAPPPGIARLFRRGRPTARPTAPALVRSAPPPAGRRGAPATRAHAPLSSRRTPPRAAPARTHPPPHTPTPPRAHAPQSSRRPPPRAAPARTR